MTFDFDQEIQRENTNSVRFDGRQYYFGATDVSPLWVADMDFAVPECIARALMRYLETTRDFAADFIAREIPQIKLIKPEATYLLWLDCRGLAMSDAQLRDFFVRECKVGMNPGTVFGEGGSGFMRMNIGTRRAVVGQALANIKNELESGFVD